MINTIRHTEPDDDWRGPLTIMISGRHRVYRSFKDAMDSNPELFKGHTYGNWYMSLAREKLRKGQAVNLNGAHMVAINRLPTLRIFDHTRFRRPS